MSDVPFRTAISPSDLTFRWSGCKRCFWMKYRLGIDLSMPFPGIVAALSSRQEKWYKERTTADFSRDLPPGKVHSSGKKLVSAPIIVNGVETQYTIVGKYDFLIEYDDGSFGVIDTKLSAKLGKADLYWPQLAAYRHLLHYPATGERRDCSTLGLMVWTPTHAHRGTSDDFTVGFTATYEAVTEPSGEFEHLISAVVQLIDSDTIPPTTDCATCQFVAQHPSGRSPS